MLLKLRYILTVDMLITLNQIINKKINNFLLECELHIEFVFLMIKMKKSSTLKVE